MKCTEEDCKFIFDLQSEEGNRRHFQNSDQLIWAEHKEWFLKSLKNSNIQLWKVIYSTKEVGFLRTNYLHNNKIDVSIMVSTQYRSLGIAKKSLELLMRENKYRGECFQALVHDENTSSYKLFSSLGFQFVSRHNEFKIMEFLNCH